MAAAQGLNTLLTDGGAVYIDDTWLDDLAELSPAPHHPVLRVTLSSDAHNHVHIDTIRRGLQLCRDKGFEVLLVFHLGIEHFYSLPGNDSPENYPNAPLGLGGNPFNSNYINHYSTTVFRVIQQLGTLITRVQIGNEPNLRSCDLSPGDYCPPTAQQYADGQGGAMAPECYAALLYTTALAIRANCPWVTLVLPASMSLILRFSTDPNGPWVRGFWNRMVSYLRANGAVEPFSWQGLALNMEGPITSHAGAVYVSQSMHDTMRECGFSGPLVVGEWGTPAWNINHPMLDAAFDNLAGTMDLMFFYSHHLRTPGDLTGYGCTGYSADSTWGRLVPIQAQRTSLFGYIKDTLKRFYNAV